jgi:hypothetical protein
MGEDAGIGKIMWGKIMRSSYDFAIVFFSRGKTGIKSG